MIKLGDAYFDEASIVAIAPCLTPDAEDAARNYTIQLADGYSYPWIAEAAEVQRRLEEVGLIAPQTQAVPLDFPPDEVELLTAAFMQGYNYAAKDFSGQVYAYRELPQKGNRCWNAYGTEQQSIRLHGEFAALFWDDEYPLNISVMLERG